MTEVIFVDGSRSLDLRNIGGTNSVVRRLISELDRDIQVTLVDISEKPSSYPPSFYGEHYRNAPNIISALAFIATRPKAVVVDIYLKPIQRPFFWIFRGFFFRRKFSKIFFSYPRNSIKRFLSFFDAMVMQYTAPIFCVSQRQIDYLKRNGVHNVLRLWPPVPQIYFSERDQSKAEENQCTVAWVGRLDYGKGADIAFDVMNRLEDIPHVNFEILAHTVENNLSVAVPHQITTNPKYVYREVSYSGFTPEIEHEVSAVLARATIFLCPYRELESTIDCPMLIQEAAAAGAIVISRDYPIIREIINGRGVLLGDFLEHESLLGEYTRVIRSLLTDSAVADMQEKSRFERSRLRDLYESSVAAQTFCRGLTEQND